MDGKVETRVVDLFPARRRTGPLAPVVLLAMALLLSGCGRQTTAARPRVSATRTPLSHPTGSARGEATVTAQGRRRRPAPSPTLTAPPTAVPTPSPTATPRALVVRVRVVPFPDLPVAVMPSDAPTGLAASVRAGRVLALVNDVLEVVDPLGGRILASLSVADAVSMALDERQGRDYAVSGDASGAGITLARVQLTSGRAITRTLTGVPHGVVVGWASDPATGDLYLATVPAPGTAPAATLTRLAPDGAVQRQRLLRLTPTGLYVDSRRGYIIVTRSDGAGHLTLTAYNARTLAPRWTVLAPYVPARIALDPLRGQLWLLAVGGRVTVLATATGRTVAIIHPSYTKPAQWTARNDLVLDGQRGVGYASWCGDNLYGPAQCAIDRIDLRTRRRNVLTSAGGGVVAVLARSGRLITVEDGIRLVLRAPADGHVLGLLDDVRAVLGAAATGLPLALDGSQVVVDQSGAAVMIACASTVPYQNDITGASTAPGLVIARYQDEL